MRYISLWAAAAAIAALAVGGCGSEQDTTVTASSHLAAAKRRQITPRPVALRDQLFAVERRWPGIAISDRLAIDRHGVGRIVRGGGGGGLRIEKCTFSPGEMAAWLRDLRRLGTSVPTATSPQRQPATYLIDYRGHRVVQTGAMPRRYLPFTRRVVRLLHGRKGCHTIYSQRTH